jgi:hypothetical protein
MVDDSVRGRTQLRGEYVAALPGINSGSAQCPIIGVLPWIAVHVPGCGYGTTNGTTNLTAHLQAM